MDLRRQIVNLKEKNQALCIRRRSLNGWIVFMKNELSNGCWNHREVHKKLYECIDEVELLDFLIEANGSEILRLRRELKDVS